MSRCVVCRTVHGQALDGALCPGCDKGQVDLASATPGGQWLAQFMLKCRDRGAWPSDDELRYSSADAGFRISQIEAVADLCGVRIGSPWTLSDPARTQAVAGAA